MPTPIPRLPLGLDLLPIIRRESPQRQPGDFIDNHHNSLHDQRHTEEDGGISVREAKFGYLAQDREAGVHQPDQQERQGERDGGQEAFFAVFGVPDVQTQTGRHEREEDVRHDVERAAGR